MGRSTQDRERGTRYALIAYGAHEEDAINFAVLAHLACSGPGPALHNLNKKPSISP